jgi:hypothetical protein
VEELAKEAIPIVFELSHLGLQQAAMSMTLSQILERCEVACPILNFQVIDDIVANPRKMQLCVPFTQVNNDIVANPRKMRGCVPGFRVHPTHLQQEKGNRHYLL